METASSYDSRELEKSGFNTTQTPFTEDSKPSGWRRLASFGVELRGVQPVTLEERNDSHPINLLSFWWTVGVTLLAVTNGLVGTLYMGLSLKAASLVILFFTLLSAIPPAAFSVLGPQTGMRQIIQARYSFGRYAVMVVAIFNLATTTGWSIVSAILAGQTLSAVSGGGLSWDLGIIIISVISLVIAFLGYKVVHAYERWAWIPALIAILITVGCGGHLLKNQAPAEPTTGAAVMSYACVTISFTVTWLVLPFEKSHIAIVLECPGLLIQARLPGLNYASYDMLKLYILITMASDFCVYMQPDIPKIKPFLYTYIGLTVPIIPLMVLGAAIGGAIPSIPEWADAFDAGSTGGVMLEMLKPAGGFGKFIAVVLAFSLIGNLAGTMYSISIQFQVLLPIFYRVPRFVFSIVITAIIIAVAIPIAKTLIESLENFLAIISYWGGVLIGVLVVEYLYFRKSNPANYDPAIWNDASKLPLGVAAFGAVAVPFGLIVPCMAQTWYTGPIAKTTGDIGFEVGLPLSAICYFVFRKIEIRLTGR